MEDVKKMELVIADKNGSRIYTFVDNDEKEEALKNAENARLENILRYEKYAEEDDMSEYWTEQLEKERKIKYEIMTYEEFLIREKKYLIDGRIMEVTEENFNYALNVLPPICWCTIGSIEMFCIREMYTRTYTTQYAHDYISGKYYSAMVDVYDKDTWIHNILRKLYSEKEQALNVKGDM